VVAAAARARLRLEEKQQATDQVMTAWRQWYREALESVRRLAVTGPSPAVDARVAAAQAGLQ
jgi:hypothetical protein